MRKAALYGLVVVCLCMLFSLSGPAAQRNVNRDGGGVTGTGPQAQAIQVQKPVTVVENVVVTNFPLDAEGNLKVSGGSTSGQPALRFVGITHATFLDETFEGVGVLTLSRACAAEFPGTRLCQLREILTDTIPAPPEWPGLVRATGAEPGVLAGGEGRLGGPSVCLRSTGLTMSCSYSTDGPGPWPAACCG